MVYYETGTCVDQPVEEFDCRPVDEMSLSHYHKASLIIHFTVFCNFLASIAQL